MGPPTLGRTSGVGATNRELATVLATALRGLVEYVDARTGEYTEDDDVRTSQAM